METLNFKMTFLGQSVCKYQVPFHIYETIRSIYTDRFNELPQANKQLIGKIENEHSLFFDGPPNDKMRSHNHVTTDILKWFETTFNHYLNFNKVKEYKTHLNSIWINRMKENEYNPVHVHQGSLYTGLSSVMILKLPEQTGVEYSSSDLPMNGRLQILGSASGQFANVDYQPDLKERDFYVFPYDMRHCVYPFNGPGERITLAANMDVDYNPIANRGVS